LGVLTRRRCDALFQQTVDDEIERSQSGKPESLDRERFGLWEEPTKRLHAEESVEPDKRLVAARKYPEVGVATFVARACAKELSEGDKCGGPTGRFDVRAVIRVNVCRGSGSDRVDLR
jgi:hypothetical protein